MKKLKLEDLKKLEENGWNISVEDKEKISKIQSDSDFRKTMGKIMDGIGLFSEENRASNNSIFEAISINTAILQSGFKSLADAMTAPRDYNIDVRRNKQGFISKIFVKQEI